MKMRNISRRRSRSSDYAELDHFMFLFSEDRRQRNVQRFKTHVHSYCFDPFVWLLSSCRRPHA